MFKRKSLFIFLFCLFSISLAIGGGVLLSQDLTVPSQIENVQEAEASDCSIYTTPRLFYWKNGTRYSGTNGWLNGNFSLTVHRTSKQGINENYTFTLNSSTTQIDGNNSNRIRDWYFWGGTFWIQDEVYSTSYSMNTGYQCYRRRYQFKEVESKYYNKSGHYYNIYDSRVYCYNNDGEYYLAVWYDIEFAPNVYTIYLNKQSGSGGSSYYYEGYGAYCNKTYYAPDASYSTNWYIDVPTRTGYTFQGYYTSTSGGGKAIFNSNGYYLPGTTEFTSSTTLYAYWTVNNYSISYTMNSGSHSGSYATQYTFSTSSQTKSIGSASRTGYSYSASANNGCSISGTTLTIPANTTGAITVTYSWTGNVITLTLNKNGGSGGTSTIYYRYNTNEFYSNSALTSRLYSYSIPSKTGYIFNEYYGDGSSGGNNEESYLYDDGSFAGDLYYDIYKNATLYASWSAKTITITLNKNGGSGGTDTFYYRYNTNKFYSDSSCSKEITSVTLPSRSGGYSFSYYYGDGSCGGNNGESYITSSGTFAGDLNYDIYANATLYAKWVDSEKPVIHRATRTQNGTDGYYVYAYVTDNVGVNRVQFPTWTESGGQDDIQSSWTTNSAASGTSGSWTVGGNSYNYRYYVARSDHKNEKENFHTHIYAYDAAGNQSDCVAQNSFYFSFTLNFNGNGNTGGSTSAQGFTYPTAQNLRANGFTKTGYSFAGWATSANASVSWNNQASFTSGNMDSLFWNNSTTSATIYAKWSINTYYFTDSCGYWQLYHATNITVTASAADGSTFTLRNVSSGATSTGTNPSITISSKQQWRAEHTYSSTTITFTMTRANTSYDYNVWSYDGSHAALNAHSGTWVPTGAGSGTYYIREYIYFGANTSTGISGASVSPTSGEYGRVKPTFTATVATGYNFDGWYEGSSKISSSASFVLNESVTGYDTDENGAQRSYTLTAKATPKTYSVGSGKSTHTGTLTVAASGTFNSGLSISWSAGSATGYTYSFSNVKVYGGTSTSGTLLATYTSGTSATFTMNSTTGYYSNIYVYATHTRTAKTYTVSSGKSTYTNALTVATSGTFDSGLSISWSAGSATGYTYSFSHVKVYGGTSTSGTLLATYTSGTSATFTMNSTTGYYSNIYVYATHTRSANSYTITYKANGGSGSDQTQGVTYDSNFTTKAANTFSKTGYTFAGWGGSYPNASTSYKYTTAGNLTLNAQWTANSYTITYKANGGTGVDQTQGVTYDSNFTTKAANTFSKTGYTFAGWGGSYPNASTSYKYTTAGDTTLNAQWTANAYTIKFNKNDNETRKATGETADLVMTYDQSKNLTTNGFSRPGYVYGGWSTTPTGGVAYIDGQSVINLTSTPGGTVTLYAVWQDTWQNHVVAPTYTSGWYQVDSAEKLAWVANEVNVNKNNTINVLITGEIDLAEYDWYPIGTSENPFKGQFNGNFRTIKNIKTIDNTNAGVTGLFGYVGSGAIIQKVCIDIGNNSIKATNYAGGVAGYAVGSVQFLNILVKGTVSSDNYAGGIVGYFNGSGDSNAYMKQCVVIGGTTAGTNKGILAGGVSNATLETCLGTNANNTLLVGNMSASAPTNCIINGHANGNLGSNWKHLDFSLGVDGYVVGEYVPKDMYWIAQG